MNDVVKLAAFLVFVTLGLVAASRRDERRRSSVNVLLLYLVGVNLAAGLSNHDAWPFATYPLVPNRYSEQMQSRRLDYRGVDSAGGEHAVDPDSFSPLFPLAVDVWLEKFYGRLSAAQQHEATLYLGHRAEIARARLAEGRYAGSRRLLGPLAAPDWWLYPRPPVSGEVYRGLRIYRITWKAGELYRNPAAFTRTLVAEARW